MTRTEDYALNVRFKSHWMKQSNLAKRWMCKKAHIFRFIIYGIAAIVLTYFTIHDMIELIEQFKENQPVTNAEIVSNETISFPSITVCTTPLWSDQVHHVQAAWMEDTDMDNGQVQAILRTTPFDYLARWTTIFALEDLYNLDSAFLQGTPSKDSSYYYNNPFTKLGIRESKLDNLTVASATLALQNVSDTLMLYMCTSLNVINADYFLFSAAIEVKEALEICNQWLVSGSAYVITSQAFCFDIDLKFNQSEKKSITYGFGKEIYGADIDGAMLDASFPAMSVANYTGPTDTDESVKPAPVVHPRVDGARIYFANEDQHLMNLIDLSEETETLVTIKYNTWASVNLKIGSQFVKYSASNNNCTSSVISDEKCAVSCRANLTFKLCGCWPYSLRNLAPERFHKFCGVADYRKCMSAYNKEMHGCKAQCHSCIHNTYLWNVKTGTEADNQGAGLRIICESFTYPQFVQRPSLTTASFLAQAGGILGMYLGVSWLTVFVLIVFILNFARPCFKSGKYELSVTPLVALYWMEAGLKKQNERSNHNFSNVYSSDQENHI